MAALAVRQPREEVICERLLVDPENKGEWASWTFWVIAFETKEKDEDAQWGIVDDGGFEMHNKSTLRGRLN